MSKKEKENLEGDVVTTPETTAGAVQKTPEAEALAQATEALKKATENKDSLEVIERIVTEVSKAQIAMSEVVREAAKRDAETAEVEKFEELTNDKLLKLINEMPEGPEKDKFRGDLHREFGFVNVENALSDNITKALHSKVTENTPNYGDIKAMREAHDYALILTAYNGGNVTINSKADKTEFSKEKYVEALEKLKREGHKGADLMLKGVNEALDTQTATEGTEWVPTLLSGDLAEDLYLQLRVTSLFPRLRMRSKTYEVPIRTARSAAYRVAEATAYNEFFTNKFTAHNMETGKVTFAAEKLGVLNFISDELEQDAVLDMMPIMRADILFALAYGIEDATINGSTATNDLDNASGGNELWTSTADPRNAWDGLRKRVNASSITKIDGGTFSADVLANARKNMGKYGTNPSDLAWIVGPKAYIELIKLDEVLTLEKYGPNATILTGELGRVHGIPIVVSENIYENLNASGVYDNMTTDNTVMVLTNRKAHMFGDRMDIRIEQDRSILSQQSALTVSWRGDFQKMYQAAVDTDNVVYNIAV